MDKLVEEFCDVDGYRCLMPIQYELVDEGNGVHKYRKVKCNCHNVREGKCDKGTSCKHFLVAEDYIMDK